MNHLRMSFDSVMIIDYAKSCVAPSYKCFQDKFEGDLKAIVQVFKYASFFFLIPAGLENRNLLPLI